MANLLSVENLTKSYGDRMLFADITFGVDEGDKIGIVARNGTGKTTMLRIIAGDESADSGTVVCRNGLRIGYLPQEPRFAPGATVRSAAMEELPQTSHIDDPEAIMRLLASLGLDDQSKPVEKLSGGQRKKLAIARAVIADPELLILDEPTNHLDIESIQWLEQFLQSKSKAVLLVSHDRAFIDNVTNRTIEISCGKAYDYRVNYSKFVELRKERVEQQQRAYENQQKQIAEIKDFIERFRYKPTKSNQVQSRIKQLEKIVPIEVDEVDNSALHLKFPPAPRSGDFPLILENVGKSYGDHNVFSGATFTLRRGEKVAFVGKNGEGKSTLVKCIMHEIPFDGDLKIGHNVNIGYFAQNQAQLLDGEITVFDTIDHVATGDMRLKVRDILGAFMFGGEASDKKVKVLSGGEKTRLAMIRLLLEPRNLLILDEPTNHLDMKTKDILKEAIKAFDGTVILVSHDRQFLDGLVDKVYEFGGGKVREHLGGIYDFLNRKNITNLSDLERKVQPQAQPKHKPQAVTPTTIKPEKTAEKHPKLSYAEQKEMQKFIKKAEKEVKDSEARIAELEKAISELEAKLSAGDSSSEILESYASMQKKLENEMSVWELAQIRLDEIKND